MIDMKAKFLALVSVFLMIMCSTIAVADYSSSDSTASELLLDKGNGETDWMDISKEATISETIAKTLQDNGHTYAVAGGNLVVDGKDTSVLGKSGSGTLDTSGTTGTIVSAKWIVYIWSGSEWIPTDDLTQTYGDQSLALGFYSDGMIPVETPLFKSSWTSIGGDAENSYNQTAELNTGVGTTIWQTTGTENSTGVYGAVLYARGQAIVKLGHDVAGGEKATLISYDVATGSTNWSFVFDLEDDMSTSAPLIAGQYVYVQSANGMLYRFDWRVGPGEGYGNVTSINDAAWNAGTPIPQETVPVTGNYANGPTSMVFDSGCVFLKSSNGMVYCFDNSLHLVWSRQTAGQGYYTPPTVHGDYVAVGMYDGSLTLLDKYDGEVIDSKVIYQREFSGKMLGCVNSPVFVESGEETFIFITYNDGRGMNAMRYGMAILKIAGSHLELVKDYLEVLGATSSKLTKAVDFDGVYFCGDKGTYTMNTKGEYTLISTMVSESNSSHSGALLVNNTYLFYTTYSSNMMIQIDKAGKTIGTYSSPITQFCMITPTVVDGFIISGNDGSVFAIQGEFHEYIPPEAGNRMAPLFTAVAIVSAIVILLGGYWVIARFGLKWEKPFLVLKNKVYAFFFGENYTHNKKSKHKLGLVIFIGLLLTFALALLSLCIGSETTFSPLDALKNAISAIQKGGHNLTYEELLIYNSRLPRTIAAFAVGIGLSVAGAVYQAIIKNPLVEPYIMGVSSGAGTFAIAVIAYGFTFFGLFAPQSPYLIAVAAISGGLIAFGLTMIMAEKTGGKSTNYVLSGIIIGLVFSAIQSLLMIMSGNKVTSALSWLYGSFSSITWSQIWLILIPVLALSFVPYIWAKELNLILIGDDQAKQMGLNTDVFNKLMLIFASVLTAFCVAFCGIIGFVGLVIPHLSRMILGGDHRLMLPTAMAFGGVLMIAADLLSRVLLTGFELPVGAITTVIGVPVFAYLLVKRGKSYDS